MGKYVLKVCAVFCFCLLLLLGAFFNHPHLVSPGYPGQESSFSVLS